MLLSQVINKEIQIPLCFCIRNFRIVNARNLVDFQLRTLRSPKMALSLEVCGGGRRNLRFLKFSFISFPSYGMQGTMAHLDS